MLHPDYFLYRDDNEPLPWDAPAGDRELHEDDGDRWLDAERRILKAGQVLMSALMAFEYEAGQYRDDPLAILEFDEAMRALGRMSGLLDRELALWQTAMSLVENNTQIAPRSENGRPWRPYLSPQWLLRYAETARPGDPPYVPQLLARITETEARDRSHEEEMATVCGRPTSTGRPCQHHPVFWPGRGRVAGCSRHLSPEEKFQLEDVWSAVQQKHNCPACMVPAGTPCDGEVKLRVMPDGEFPRVRTFAGRMMHSVRLSRAAPER